MNFCVVVANFLHYVICVVLLVWYFLKLLHAYIFFFRRVSKRNLVSKSVTNEETIALDRWICFIII